MKKDWMIKLTSQMRKSTLFATNTSTCFLNSACTASFPLLLKYVGVWEIPPATKASPSSATSRAILQAAWLISAP